MDIRLDFFHITKEFNDLIAPFVIVSVVTALNSIDPLGFR